MACGVVLLGGVTGLDWFDEDWLDEDWFEDVVLDFVLSSSPSPPACERVVVEPVEPPLLWPAEADEWVCVVTPSPTAAPSALKTLSPARPAWRRRLRLMCVMASRSGEGLCLPCEGPGVPVSVTCQQPASGCRGR